MKRMRVLGTGSYLPERIVSNSEVAGPLGILPATIERLTGIRERRWAAESQAPSDLAIEASLHALQAAGCAAGDVDAIILSTTSPDMAFPSTACLVQRGLGCRGVAAFDVSASCSGFLYALSMANAMILSGQARICLVVAAEVKSRFLDPADAATAVLFGDGAGAVVVRGEDDQGSNGHGVLGIRLHSDGSKHDLIRVPAGGSRVPASAETVARRDHVLRMQGASLFRIAVRRVERAVQDILKVRCPDRRTRPGGAPSGQWTDSLERGGSLGHSCSSADFGDRSVREYVVGVTADCAGCGGQGRTDPN
jgi:3-oxoacyl-[acyl-carrier-protein] synthase-3